MSEFDEYGLLSPVYARCGWAGCREVVETNLESEVVFCEAHWARIPVRERVAAIQAVWDARRGGTGEEQVNLPPATEDR